MTQVLHQNTDTSVPLFDELNPITFCLGWGLSYERASEEIRVVKPRTLAAYATDKGYRRNPSQKVLEFTAEAHNKRVKEGLIPRYPGIFFE